MFTVLLTIIAIALIPTAIAVIGTVIFWLGFAFGFVAYITGYVFKHSFIAIISGIYEFIKLLVTAPKHYPKEYSFLKVSLMFLVGFWVACCFGVIIIGAYWL